MEKMTIHRALSELKLIDSRILKAIDAIQPTGLMQKDKLVNGFYPKDEFEKNAHAKLQSVQDLIERKNKIKSAIVQANSTTKIKIAEDEMTIAEAINQRAIIELKKQLIQNLIKKHNNAKAQSERNNKEIDDNAVKLASVALAKDNVKINDGDAVAITGPFIEKNRFNLIDPLKVEELTEKMQEKIDAFESEVDAVLSEINAITIIEF